MCNDGGESGRVLVAAAKDAHMGTGSRLSSTSSDEASCSRSPPVIGTHDLGVEARGKEYGDGEGEEGSGGLEGLKDEAVVRGSRAERERRVRKRRRQSGPAGSTRRARTRQRRC